MLVERSDAFLYLLLPIALREGYDIRCEVPVTSMFLHNVRKILLPTLWAGDARCKRFNIYATTEDEPLPSMGGVGTACSCGVDSTYTIKKYIENDYKGIKLTHLLIGSISMDLWNIEETDDLYSWQAKYPYEFERYNQVSEITGLPIVKVLTNFTTFMTKRIEYDDSYRFLYSGGYVIIATIIALKKLFSIYILSASYPNETFDVSDVLTADAAHYELLSMHTVSHSGFMCFSGGGDVDRIEKTIEIAETPLAQKTLHPCLRGQKINCSSPTCSKCLRGLLTLDYYDKLDGLSEVFNIERYRNNRQRYLVNLISRKDDVFFKTLNDMYWEKYPEEMEAAAEIYEIEATPIDRSEYLKLEKEYLKLEKEHNELKSEYATASLLLLNDIPKESIIKFFETRNVHRVYYAGKSKIGKVMMDLVKGDIEVVTKDTGDVNTCDAIFIASKTIKQIKFLKKQFLTILEKEIPIYSMVDIKKELRQK